MIRQRLDQVMVNRKLVLSRSQAESYIKLGSVKVDNKIVTKPGTLVSDLSDIALQIEQQYVSRAGLKLASIAETLKLDFMDKIVLDAGSSTGGFTDYVLRHGARRVIAVEIGSEQMHSSLRSDPRIELHEKTDIRVFKTDENLDIVVADLSFVSLRLILPSIAKLITRQTQILAMVKPQFEAQNSGLKHNGVVKNDRIRRDILKDFENWAKTQFIIIDKADSKIAGANGNVERFYLLKKAEM